MSVFSKPVFVKPLGVLLPPSAFGNEIGFTVSISRKYELVEPTSITDELYVSSVILVQFGATVTIEKMALEIAKGAAHYNRYLEDTVRAQLEQATPVAEEKPRRGRRRKVEETDEEEAPVDVSGMIGMVAKSFGIFQLRIEEKEVPLVDSVPFKEKANASERNEEALLNRVAILRQYVEQISKIRQKLAAPSQESINESLGSLVPQDELEELDRQGLGSFENSLRGKITETENKARGIYEFFREKLIAKYNADHGKGDMKPFVGEFVYGSETVTVENLIANMKNEVFITVDL